MLSCFICGLVGECPYTPSCYEQELQSKQLAKEWDEQEALTQDEITELQLELSL